MSTQRASVWPAVVAVATAVVALTLINLAIFRSEAQLRDGQAFYLQLAPVDPRSLLQGDYMALNYQVASELRSLWPEQMPNTAWVRLRLDSQQIASEPELRGSLPPPSPGFVVLRVRKVGSRVTFATDGYYFEEGQGERYESARYGLFRSDGVDKALLAELADENRQPL